MSSTVHCPHFPACSGCSLIGTEYSRQLAGKVRAVSELFARVSLPGFEAEAVPAITPSPSPIAYRNRAKLVPACTHPLRTGLMGAPRAPIRLGLYRVGTHEVIDIPGCPVQMDGVNRAVEAVRAGLSRLNVSIYDEATNTGDLRFVTVRQGADTGELLVGFVTRKEGFPQGARLADQLGRHCRGVVGVVQNINPEAGNVIFGTTTRVIAGQPYFEEVVCGVRLRLGMTSFFQVNTGVAEKAYEAILAGLELSKDATLVDLYCGVGSIGLAAARAVRRVVGVEEALEAVELAKSAAAVNGLRNVEFRTGLVAEQLPRLTAEFKGGGGRTDTLSVVVNPPRKGLEAGVTDGLLRLGPRRIAYLSCAPPTLIRDLDRLAEGGYAVRRVELFDMFPQTEQVEILAILAPDGKRDYATLRRRRRGEGRGKEASEPWPN